MEKFTETERILFETLCGFEFEAAEKLEVLESYKKEISTRAYNYIFEIIIFTEEIRTAFIEK